MVKNKNVNELGTMQTLYDKKKNKNKRIFDCKISSAGGRKFQTNKYNSILALVHMFLVDTRSMHI